MSEPPDPDRSGGQTYVQLGARRLSATQFALYSGEVRMQLAALDQEFETLTQHGIITDGLMQAAAALAEVCGNAQIAVLAELAQALGRALAVLSLDPVSEGEVELLREAVEAMDSRVMQSLDLADPMPAVELIQRLERLALGLPPGAGETPARESQLHAGGVQRTQAVGPEEPVAADEDLFAPPPQGAPSASPESKAPAFEPSRAAGEALASPAQALRAHLQELEALLDALMQARLDQARATQEVIEPPEFERLERLLRVSQLMRESLQDLYAVHQRLAQVLDETRSMLGAARRLASGPGEP